MYISNSDTDICCIFNIFLILQLIHVLLVIDTWGLESKEVNFSIIARRPNATYTETFLVSRDFSHQSWRRKGKIKFKISKSWAPRSQGWRLYSLEPELYLQEITRNVGEDVRPEQQSSKALEIRTMGSLQALWGAGWPCGQSSMLLQMLLIVYWALKRQWGREPRPSPLS